MNERDYFDQYVNQYFIPSFRDQIHVIDRMTRKNSKDLIDKITLAINALVDKTTEYQESKKKGVLHCIGVHLLRTEIYLRNYNVLLCAYDENFLFDDSPIEIEVDFHDFFQPLEETYTFLLQNKSAFNGKIKENHVRILVQKFVDIYRSYFIELARISARNVTRNHCFKHLQTSENFFMIAGEYKGLFDEIYTTQKETREAHQIQAILHDIELGKEDLACKVYPDYYFNNCLFTKRNLSKSKFIECEFTSCNFNGSYLVNSSFSKCHFKQIKFEGVHIFDACFHQCSFEDCDFSNAIGFITPPKLNLEVVLGFSGLSFCECSFNHVIFIDANLSGAHFTDTTFENVSFEETLLDHTIFSKESLFHICLSDRQMDNIDLV